MKSKFDYKTQTYSIVAYNSKGKHQVRFDDISDIIIKSDGCYFKEPTGQQCFISASCQYFIKGEIET